MTLGIAFVFPGQGSQAVGMGADVYASSPAARAVFDAADRALDMPLSRLCFEGPEETLRETINAQPAIVTVSLALLAAMREALGASVPDLVSAPAFGGPPQPQLVAGHSVGEYAALVAAGALSLPSALRLVRERGRLMHHEGTVCAGSMAAILGMDDVALAAICDEATHQARAELGNAVDTPTIHPGQGRVMVANFNSPGQYVISGERRALEIAMEAARAKGAKRVVQLAVSGAFHSPVMEPAAAHLRDAIGQTEFNDPEVPVISNITAEPLSREELRDELARQVAAPVQWSRTVEYLARQGVDTFVEIGPGQVLSGLIKRIARPATILTVNDRDDVSAVSERLRAPFGIEV